MHNQFRPRLPAPSFPMYGNMFSMQGYGGTFSPPAQGNSRIQSTPPGPIQASHDPAMQNLPHGYGNSRIQPTPPGPIQASHGQAMQNLPHGYVNNTGPYGACPPYGHFGQQGPFVCPNPCCNPNAPLCPCKIRMHGLQVDRLIQTDDNDITASRFTKADFFTYGTEANKLLNVSNTY